MKKLALRLGSVLSDRRIPKDGMRRYLYDIRQPLTLLVLTASFTGAFFTYDPYARAMYNSDFFFFCNADANLEKTIPYYTPFWDPRLYFTVNIAFGQFSFSTAKIVDAAWDAGVGRGGQFLAAMVAYQTLRRSLNLTMETCTVTISAVASLYFQQIQLESVGQLVHTMFWHWGSSHLEWRPSKCTGRLRSGVQLFACIYVLLFSTLVSVMTGYRAQLSSYGGYDTDQAGPLFPIDQLVRPRMVVYDGARVGLPDTPVFAHDTILYPEPVRDADNRTWATGDMISYDISDLLDSSREFMEPYGALVDYYYTCLAIKEWLDRDLSFHHDNPSVPTKIGRTGYYVECASHNCSCSAPILPSDTKTDSSQINDIITSTISINAKLWELSAPPLNVGLVANPSTPEREWSIEHFNDEWQTANDYWFKRGASTRSPMVLLNGTSYSLDEVYMYDEIVFNEATIMENGRCVAEDAYSWGFSSLLLLTFCSYTILFELALILLQTDVYWNSRHDRDYQSHSIYTDILYLAEELKTTFGQHIEDHMQSPKAFDKRVQSWKQGLRLDVRELPLSRWQEWRLSRAKKHANRKAGTASEDANDLTLALRNLSPPNVERHAADDTPYHGLIVEDGAGSSSQAVSKSDRRSTSEELTPSLGDVQILTEDFVSRAWGSRS